METIKDALENKNYKDFSKPLNFYPLDEKAEEKRLISKDRPKRVRIFKSDLLERFTLVRWYEIYIFWVPVILLMATYHFYNTQLNLVSSILTILSGILFWTLAEYLIHKYPFHFNGKSEWSKKIVYMMHGNHHDDPHDPLRGVMPILPAIFYLSIIFSIFKLTIPSNILMPFMIGFLIGYLLYDGIHYYTHHGKPKNQIGKYLRRVHLVHHVHDNVMYGISSPLWDFVFGTYLKKGQQIKE